MSSLDFARTDAVNQNSLMRVVMGSVTGTMIEWYDFYIFGSLTSVLAVKFYPPGNDTFALIAYLATFAVGFLVRPFGALFFGCVGDIVGRRIAFIITLSIMRVFVVSTTLRPIQHPEITILRFKVAEAIAELKEEEGKDIWLFGGGVLFRSLLDEGLVDAVELSVVPVLLGDGIRLLPKGRSWPLRYVQSKVLRSGILTISYDVSQAS